MFVSPIESAKLISSTAKHVTISDEGVTKAADMVIQAFLDDTISMETYKKHKLHPKDSTLPSAIDWIFFIDTLNFSFWSETGKKYEVTYHGEKYSGYWSLCAAVNRAIGEGYNISSPAYYSDVTIETLQHIFRSDSGIEIPLLKERHRILNETGKCLVEKFNGSFNTCLSNCEGSAKKLLQLVIKYFPSYRDEATIDNHKVSFYKRAQILIGDLWCFFEGKGYGSFEDIDQISMFADYRIPQVLVYLGVLKYSDELQETLKKGELIENGHRYEIEIRGCTIWAVELMYQYMKKKQDQGDMPQNIKMNAVLIDNFLWDYRREYAKDMEHIPFHKTRCMYY